MPEIVQTALKSAAEVVSLASVHRAANGIGYASYGDIQLSSSDLDQVVGAVPRSIARALDRKAYYFVPLTLGEAVEDNFGEPAPDSADPDRIMIAAEFSAQLADTAFCHRDAKVAGTECVFISTRLLQDRFTLAFEFYINVGHHFVDAAGVPESFMALVWSQAEAGVRGETSQDAWNHRGKAVGQTAMERTSSRTSRPVTRNRRIRSLQASAAQTVPVQRTAIDEKARTEFFEAAFADAIAIYLLSLTVDFDYTELREREYPLLAPDALSDRLRLVDQMFPPNPGHEFSIRPRPAS